MKTLLLPLAFSCALIAAIPSQYEADLNPLLRRAVGDQCKAPEGSGTCENKANCPGISYPTGLCPKDPADVQCCVKISCNVPSSGSGLCRSRKNNGCSGGTFHSGHCPGSSDIQCCVKSGEGSDPPPTKPAPPKPCTPASYDTLMFSTPISGFIAAKQSQNPECFEWSDDGCSCSPDDLGEFDFLPPCWRHDFGYRNAKIQGRFDNLKTRIDDNLKTDLYNVCAKFSGWESFKGVQCRRIADVYVVAVRKFGRKKRDEIPGGEMKEARLEKRKCDIPGF